MNEATSETNTSGDAFLKKPTKDWLHTDAAVHEGIAYKVKYVGCIGINESMRSLSFDVRTQVARESIRRVAESARLLILPRRNHKNEEDLNRILSTSCQTQWSGMSVELSINTQYLCVTQLECNDTLFKHTMQNISFACGGETDIQNFVAYVAKDDVNGRACYVFECAAIDGLANKVITTIGQAFELRFRKFLDSMPSALRENHSLSPPAQASKIPNGYPPAASKSQHLLIGNGSLNGNHHVTGEAGRTTFGHQLSSTKQQPIGQLHQDHLINIPSHAPPPPLSANAHISNHSNHLKSNSVLSSSSSSTSQHQHQQQSQHAQDTRKCDELLERMRWFHGLMTRDKAEKLLINDGDYLVRETNKAERQYVLSGRYKGECRHIFLVDPSGVVRTKDRVFENICHLIQYHQDNSIPIISKDNELLLENPIDR